jgi:enoyl-CoA hydratase/carnithine racemase
MEMLILGDKVEPDEAERWGLINKVVEDEQLDATINEMTANITSKSSLVMAIGKEAFYKQLEMDVESAYAYANKVIAQNLLARDAQEGIDAFLEKRTPKWENR